MDQRYSTIIFVPHARAKFRKLKVSHRLLISLVSIVTSSLCLSTFFSVQYFTSLSQTHELTKLRHENKELETANEQFSKSVESLRGQLRTVEDRTRKLAIYAGISSLDDSAQGGVGGLRPNDLGDNNPYRDDVDKMAFRSKRIESDLSVLEQKLVAQSQLLASTPSIAPIRGILTDGFGGRSDPFTGERGTHNAVDISSAAGQPVRAPADGIVVKAEWANGYGNVIFLSHGYGYSTRYGHLSGYAIKPGQHVKRGDIIGYVGSTGRATGPHLHYEVRLNNNPVNPLEYILNAF
ncbi:MAG TPA: M23 family metallopeptidase [Thermoanaerobaculia bacterium]|jgi:murein DD-endopeptidase MepM/ murein hydrolase activator NlpD|nr:M23 family metallopeptidase [Thermoanaerobaculia bacterium]